MYDFFVEEAARVNNTRVNTIDYDKDLFNAFMEADMIRSYVNNTLFLENISEANVLKGIWAVIKGIFEKILRAIGIFVDKFKALFKKDKELVKAAENAAKTADSNAKYDSDAVYEIIEVSSDDRIASDCTDKFNMRDIKEFAKSKEDATADDFAKFIMGKIGDVRETRYAQVVEKLYFKNPPKKYKFDVLMKNANNIIDQFNSLEMFSIYFESAKRIAQNNINIINKLASVREEVGKTPEEHRIATGYKEMAIAMREIVKGIAHCVSYEYKFLRRALSAIASQPGYEEYKENTDGG